jgi:hypothetical protein
MPLNQLDHGGHLPDISSYSAGTAPIADVPGEHHQHLCMLPAMLVVN